MRRSRYCIARRVASARARGTRSICLGSGLRVGASEMTTLSISSAPILMIGFWLGVQHAAEPDHVAAVTTMAAQAPSLRSASRLGLLWGLGHSSTMMLVGLAMIVLGRELPADLSRAFEGAAGVSLLLLAWRGRRAGGATAPTSSTGHATTHSHSFMIGMVHGLAGTTAIAL